jgi:hypothetical protein
MAIALVTKQMAVSAAACISAALQQRVSRGRRCALPTKRLPPANMGPFPNVLRTARDLCTRNLAQRFSVSSLTTGDSSAQKFPLDVEGGGLLGDDLLQCAEVRIEIVDATGTVAITRRRGFGILPACLQMAPVWDFKLLRTRHSPRRNGSFTIMSCCRIGPPASAMILRRALHFIGRPRSKVTSRWHHPTEWEASRCRVRGVYS